jgi:hypothetical protein
MQDNEKPQVTEQKIVLVKPEVNVDLSVVELYQSEFQSGGPLAPDM